MADNSSLEDGKHLDKLGLIYILFTIAWTVFLSYGLIFMLVRRNNPLFKDRSNPLAIFALCILHAYYVVWMLRYPLKGYTCSMEFFMLACAMPVGAALFHLNNIRILNIATGQKGSVEVDVETGYIIRTGHRTHPPLPDIIELPLAKGVDFLCFMAFQIPFSTTLYQRSGRFGGFGEAVSPTCTQGDEWLLTTLWLIYWSLMYTPLTLCSIWRIGDLRYWRLQTSLCVIAGLFSFIMWVCAFYQKFGEGNRFWAPPMWFLPYVMMLEFVTVFFPLFEDISRRQQTQVLERENHNEQEETMDNTTQGGAQYSIASFEENLANDPSSLFHFAASKDFSGENIMFLNHVREWKAAWTKDSNTNVFPKGDDLRRHLFNVGVEIYAIYVNISTAQFPVNIEAGVYDNLSNIFGGAAKFIDIPESTNIITPFDNPGTLNDGIPLGPLPRPRPSTANTSEASTISNSLSHTSYPEQRYGNVLSRGLESISNIKPRVPEDLEIPGDFSASAFDEAERSIKTLVLRGVWPKYVDAMELASHRPAGESGAATKKRFWPFRSKK